MKVIVAYMSQTGNTRKVAEAIFQEIEAEKEMKELGEIGGLKDYDLAFVGFPIQAYGPANAAKSFLEKHSTGNNLALFITHATPEDSEELQPWLANCSAAAAGGNVIGVFNCQGELAQKTADFLLASGDPKLIAWAQERPSTVGQPDTTRLERARVFARETMKKFSAGG